jgi:hypothetical protein
VLPDEPRDDPELGDTAMRRATVVCFTPSSRAVPANDPARGARGRATKERLGRGGQEDVRVRRLEGAGEGRRAPLVEAFFLDVVDEKSC